MTETDFIANEQKKLDDLWRKQLHKVNRTGNVTKSFCDTFLINDLIQFGRPRPEIGNPYNCFRLTERGLRYLNEGMMD